MVDKRSFTLLEIILALAIMASLGGYFAIASARLITSHRFRHDCDHLSNIAALARHASIAYGADIALHIEQGVEGLTLWAESDEPMTAQENIIRRPTHLRHIERAVIKGAPLSHHTIHYRSTSPYEGHPPITCYHRSDSHDCPT